MTNLYSSSIASAISYKSTFGGNGSYESKTLYITQYQIIHIEITNNSNSVLNVNPNYFTLVSDQGNSYSYSPETFLFKDKIKFLRESPIQAVDVYPKTKTSGFLLFEKNSKEENPKNLFFKSSNKQLSTKVIADKQSVEAKKKYSKQ